jgi:folate-binding protein YgfZ
MDNFFYKQPSPAIIKTIGEDAEDYLQSQWTINLKKLPVGGVRFGLRLNSKGKILAGAYVLRLGKEEFILLSAGLSAERLISLMEENVVADEVEFSNESKTWDCYCVRVEKSGSFISELGMSLEVIGQITQYDESIYFIDERYEVKTLSVLHKKSETSLTSLTNRLKEMTKAEFDFQRIKSHCFAIPMEIGTDELPQEAGLEIKSVDFDKGCYLGQEVMARLHSMGQVQRHITVVEWVSLQEKPPTLPVNILMNEKIIGSLKSLVYDRKTWIGVAKIHKKALEQLEREGLVLEDKSLGKIRKYE